VSSMRDFTPSDTHISNDAAPTSREASSSLALELELSAPMDGPLASPSNRESHNSGIQDASPLSEAHPCSQEAAVYSGPSHPYDASIANLPPPTLQKSGIPFRMKSEKSNRQDALPVVIQHPYSEEADSSISQSVLSAPIVIDTSDSPHTTSGTVNETTTTPTINIEYLSYGDGQSSAASHSESSLESQPGLPVLAPIHPASDVEVIITGKKMRNKRLTLVQQDIPGQQSNRHSASSLEDSNTSLDIVFSDLPSPTGSANHNNSFTEPSSPVEPIDQTQVAEAISPKDPKTPVVETKDSILHLRGGYAESSPFAGDEESSIYDDMEESPSQRKRPVAKLPKPPLNSMMKKRSQKGSLAPLETPLLHIAISETDGEKSPSKSLSPYSPVMPLQDQISNILEAIPTPIRLKAGAGPNAPDVKRQRYRTPSSSQPRRTPTPSFGHPSLTLAPADEAGSRRNGVNDPEIKLYHLIQAGKEKPIKLFIRRVGENGERVMVRVGGGWADLGEYLRIYAEHHGRRAVSDGRVELQAITTDNLAHSTPRSADSRRASLLGPSTTHAADTPGSGRATPTVNVETPQSAASAGSRRSSNWDEVGLSGPFTRRADMTYEKKDWVEGIVEQAKRSMGKKGEVGDLGKTGTTRRVFFRGGTPGTE
jgi:hypothetical protein